MTDSSQLPSQVTRASIGPRVAPPRQPAVGAGRAKVSHRRCVGAPRVAEDDHCGRVAAVLGRVGAGELDRARGLRLEPPRGIVSGGRHPPGMAPGRVEDDEPEVRHPPGVLAQGPAIRRAGRGAVEHDHHWPRAGLGRRVHVDRVRRQLRVGRFVGDVAGHDDARRGSPCRGDRSVGAGVAAALDGLADAGAIVGLAPEAQPPRRAATVRPRRSRPVGRLVFIPNPPGTPSPVRFARGPARSGRPPFGPRVRAPTGSHRGRESIIWREANGPRVARCASHPPMGAERPARRRGPWSSLGSRLSRPGRSPDEAPPCRQDGVVATVNGPRTPVPDASRPPERSVGSGAEPGAWQPAGHPPPTSGLAPGAASIVPEPASRPYRGPYLVARAASSAARASMAAISVGPLMSRVDPAPPVPTVDDDSRPPCRSLEVPTPRCLGCRPSDGAGRQSGPGREISNSHDLAVVRF